MSFATFQLRQQVGIVSFNRPDRLNAISSELLADVQAAFDEAEHCREAAALLLTGAGRAFCAGEDLKEFDAVAADPSAARSHIASIQRVSRRIMFSNRIVVAAARGYAVGGGFEWLLNCDLAVAGSDLVSFLPEMQLGQFPTGGLTYLLPQTIGHKRTMQMLALGERFSADHMLELGLVNWVVEPEDVLERAIAIAQRIADQTDPDSISRLKRMVRGGSCNVEESLNLEEQATIESFARPASRTASARAISGEGRKQFEQRPDSGAP